MIIRKLINYGIRSDTVVLYRTVILPRISLPYPKNVLQTIRFTTSIWYRIQLCIYSLVYTRMAVYYIRVRSYEYSLHVVHY